MIKSGLIGYNKTSEKAGMGARDAQGFLDLLVRRYDIFTVLPNPPVHDDTSMRNPAEVRSSSDVCQTKWSSRCPPLYQKFFVSPPTAGK